jgi:hypothetical protein
MCETATQRDAGSLTHGHVTPQAAAYAQPVEARLLTIHRRVSGHKPGCPAHKQRCCCCAWWHIVLPFVVLQQHSCCAHKPRTHPERAASSTINCGAQPKAGTCPKRGHCSLWWAVLCFANTPRAYLGTKRCLATAARPAQSHQHHALVVGTQQLQRADEDIEALQVCGG